MVRNWPVLTRDTEQMREALAWGIRALEAIEKWRVSEPKPF